MKKYVVFVLVALLAVGSVSAAEPAKLVINGQVAQYLSVSLDPSSVLLELKGDGTGDEEAGKVTLTAVSNAKNWRLTFKSDNSGFLVSKTTKNSIPYFVKVTVPKGIENPLEKYTQLKGEQAIIIKDGRTTPAGMGFQISVKIDDQGSTDILYVAAQDYTDTIVITITQG